MDSLSISRRSLLQAGVLPLPALAQAQRPRLTEFQIACMTLPYAAFSFDRALKGLAGAGYKYVAWGATHKEADGQVRQALPVEAPASAAKELSAKSRDLGLEPVMMFSLVNVEAPDSVKLHTRRIQQAAAAGVPFILTFGHTRIASYEAWIQNLKKLGPVAREAGVTVVIKQHGGNSATGKQCAQILREVHDEGIQMCYDAGNNMGYVGDDPIADIRHCWQFVRAFAIKDIRMKPARSACGPGLGEIDHYQLLLPVARTGLKIPLSCETLWAPFMPRPEQPEAIDALARRAREFLEIVTTGVQAYQG
jgi:sugar phosphate isomerase/epimerase